MANDHDYCVICGEEIPEGFGMVCPICAGDGTRPQIEYGRGDVVQFVENHKWCGCLGIVEEVKRCGNDVRYLIGVPIPQQGTAYIFAMQSAIEAEYVGHAILVSAPERKE